MQSDNEPVLLAPGGQSRPRSHLGQFAPLAVLAALLAAVGSVEPSFLSPYSLGVLADESSVTLLLAAAQTIVILLGGIDLSMAAVASLASVLIALVLPSAGFAGLVSVLALTGLIGAIHGLIHVRGQIPSFVVTLAALGVWSGVALTIAHSTIQITAGYSVIGWLQHSNFGVPTSFCFALAAVIILAFALRRLPLGRYIYAIGLAERAALLSGIRVGRVKIIGFALTGLFSGLAGMMMVARTSSGSPTIADSLLLPSIAAVVIGGTSVTGGVGGLGRTLIGVLTITVLRLGIAAFGFDPAYEPMAYGFLVVAAAALTVDRSKLPIAK
ncbi:MAG TPA: ABC transporter permease [Bradyrhizobium sp.]|nr:ABC transporter permease [Bradyrhizobium sp.]